jgi:hypothetical protein
MYPLKHAIKQMRLDNANREDRQTEVDDLQIKCTSTSGW